MYLLVIISDYFQRALEMEQSFLWKNKSEGGGRTLSTSGHFPGTVSDTQGNVL
jgi:hypothetical protein